MFIDESIIIVRSGNGGDGAASFRREKFVQFGGPDGGDGGKGGNVVIVTDPNINTLVDFKNSKKFEAGDGSKGMPARCAGKSGEDCIIKVPVGTMIREYETNKLIYDLNEANMEVTLMQGGDGGRGNIHFKTSTRKAPKIAESGKLGIELKIKLELKLLADVALVGYPSVGKSSFINKVSKAKSKVAEYHFTTLKPKLGVVRLGDESSFVVADIPGLIEGAHEGVGLGDRFLKHIERCRLIYHIIDVSELEGRTAIEDFVKINYELENYSKKLSEKKQIIVLNKIDLLYDNTKYDEFIKFAKENGIDNIYPISVATSEGIDKLIKDTWEILKEIPREELEEEHELGEILPEIFKAKEDWIITKLEDNIYHVDGQIVDNVLKKYVFTGDEGVIHFLQIMRSLGMENKLDKAGVQEGDTIIIAGYEFEYIL